jgi:hypothetical protein
MRKEVRNMYKLGFADYLLLIFYKANEIETRMAFKVQKNKNNKVYE